MITLFWLIFWLCGLLALAYYRTTLIIASGAIGAGLLITCVLSNAPWLLLCLLWVAFIGAACVLHNTEYRRKFLILPLFTHMQGTLPAISETEKVAIEAGTVGWESELFSGAPQWEKLLTIPAPTLSEEEQAFIDGPVNELCESVQDWQVTHTDLDLPAHTWTLLKKHGFFGLVIPKKFGGKGFSEFAHSEILAILAGRSLTLASTVAVPNSLGPAELLLHYGTPEQRDYYLPRLSKGEEIPCFALTGPDAGSDAGGMSDTGIICKENFEGEEIIGIRLNWNKRYITLAPIATLLGLAFKLYDPDQLIGTEKNLGITCALIPTQTPGITIGRRHLALNTPFQNGPTQGKDVFIPLDWIIGGPKRVGQGWRMLVECLSTGRAISLPSSAAGGGRVSTLACGAYSRIRRQFRHPLCDFEGVQEALAYMGGSSYLSEAVRQLTVAMIDRGERPSVPGAIAKYHVTEMGRHIACHAMDILGGKGIMMGPSNYLASSYQGAPIGITVEGANILTRNMIIFGQGAIRCHPYVLKEMQALEHENIDDFEHYLGEHCRFALANVAHAFFHGLTGARFASSPLTSPETRPYFQQLARASSAFALFTDAIMGLFGGKLKFKESLSARLGDALSMMYLMSAVLKRYQDQGSQKMDLPFVQWSLDHCLTRFWGALDQILDNLPQRGIAWSLRIITMPVGLPRFSPKDKVKRQITECLTTNNDARTRLQSNSFIASNAQDSLAVLEKAFQATVQYEALLTRVYNAVKHADLAQSNLTQCVQAALKAKIITEAEANELYEVDKLCQAAIAVDDFSATELKNLKEVTC